MGDNRAVISERERETFMLLDLHQSYFADLSLRKMIPKKKKATCIKIPFTS